MDPANLNLVLLAILAAFALGGLRRGLVLCLFDALTLVLALAVAESQSTAAGAFLARQVSLPAALAPPLGFLAILVAGEILRLLGATLLQCVLAPLFGAVPVLRYVNHLGGVGAGLLRGVVVLAIGLTLLQKVGPASGLAAAVGRTAVGQALVAVSDLGVAPPDVLPSVGIPVPAPGFLAAAPPAAALPPVADATIDPADEATLLEMTNLARSQAGLPSLASDGRLLTLARQHSLDMYRQGYFAHDAPLLGAPADRLRAAGVRFNQVGENIAHAPTVAEAFQGLIASPDHRANILGADFQRIGVGVARSPVWGVVVTQDFTN